MDLHEMSERAVRVRALFAEVDAAASRRPWTTDEVMLGFVGDAGDLAKLVLGKAGVRPRPDLDDALAHELADCLWSLLVLADDYGVDLDASFTRLMIDLQDSLTRKLQVTDGQELEQPLEVRTRPAAGVESEVGRPKELAPSVDRRSGDRDPASRPRVVCLCGSLRFMSLFESERRRLTALGAVVLAPESISEQLTPARREALGTLHLRRIDLADEVRVVSEGGYLGSATRREIAYARENRKEISSVDPALAL